MAPFVADGSNLIRFAALVAEESMDRETSGVRAKSSQWDRRRDTLCLARPVAAQSERRPVC